MQTAGELDFETLFNEADLVYAPMAYLLFITFVVIMPILFSNLLVSPECGADVLRTYNMYSVCVRV